MVTKQHIDDVQPATVEEHYELIMAEKSTIDSKSLDATKDNLPSWFDERLFKLGQQYYKKNVLSLGISQILGLLAIIAEPDILNVLVFTNASSTICTAYKRYAQTLIHAHNLSTEDVNDPNSLFFKSLNVIRWKHTMSSKMHQKRGYHGIYIKDMVITQFGFIGYCLIHPDALAFSYTSEEREGYNHFWKVIGYLLDIPDRLNLCRKTADETLQLCKMILTDRLAKHMQNPSEEFVNMSRHAVDGLWHVNVTLHNEGVMWMLYNLSGLEYSKPLSLYTRLNLMYHGVVMYCHKLPYIGYVFRVFSNTMLIMLYNIIQKVSVIAWLTLGKENSQLCIFPKWKS